MNPLLYFIQPIANFLAEILVNGLVFSAILFCWAFSVILLQKRWSAATRHRVWLLMFIALALTPVLSLLKQAFPITSDVLHRGEIPVGSALRADRQRSFLRNDPIKTNGDMVTDLVEVIPLSDGTVGLPEASMASDWWVDWVGAVDWPVVVSAIWAALTLGCLLRLIVAIHGLWQLHTSARPLKIPHRILGQTRRQFQLAESDRISAPMAIGLWAPKILVPPGFCDRLSRDEFVQILLHEIGHIERNDDWSNFLVQVLTALNPLNPFLWIGSRSLSLAREMACDDWVVAGGIRSKDYANLLARLASNRTWAPVLASGVVREGNQLYKRVERILDQGCDRKLRPSYLVSFQMLAGLVGSAATVLFFVPALAVVPQARAAEPIQHPNELSVQQRMPGPVEHADPEVISVLKQAAKNDSDPQVRREAVRSLLRLGSDDATTALVELLDESNDTETRLFILRTLTRQQCALAPVRAKLSQLAENGQPEMIRILALQQLGRTNDAGAVDQLIAIYKSTDRAELKRACLRSLAQLPTKPAKEFLMEMAKSDPDPSIRSEALRMLVDGARRPARFIVRSPGVMIGGRYLGEPFGEDLGSDFPEGPSLGLSDQLDDLDTGIDNLFIKTRKLHDQFYFGEPGQLPAPERPASPIPPPPPLAAPPLPPAPPAAGEQQQSQPSPTPTPN